MRRRILVINDNPDFLELVRDLLTDEQYQVSVYTKSQHAFQRAKDEMPDLVVLDLIFGGEPDGWAILDMLKLDPNTKHIPVILCSAAVRQLREVAPSLAYKGVHCLEKPFELDELLSKIAQALTSQAPPERQPA